MSAGTVLPRWVWTRFVLEVTGCCRAYHIDKVTVTRASYAATLPYGTTLIVSAKTSAVHADSWFLLVCFSSKFVTINVITRDSIFHINYIVMHEI